MKDLIIVSEHDFQGVISSDLKVRQSERLDEYHDLLENADLLITFPCILEDRSAINYYRKIIDDFDFDGKIVLNEQCFEAGGYCDPDYVIQIATFVIKATVSVISGAAMIFLRRLINDYYDEVFKPSRKAKKIAKSLEDRKKERFFALELDIENSSGQNMSLYFPKDLNRNISPSKI